METTTKMLLSLIKERRSNVSKSIDLQNRKQMWVGTSDKLCPTSQQEETKFCSLERRYKN